MTTINPYKTVIVGYSSHELTQCYNGTDIQNLMMDRLTVEKVDQALRLMENTNYTIERFIEDNGTRTDGKYYLNFHDEETYLEFQFIL